MLAASNKLAGTLKGAGRVIRSILGPGWLVMLADVDAPSLLTAMQSGYYLSYLMIPWLILLIIPLYFTQELTIRLALGSGRGIGEIIKDRYGKRVALSSLLLMMLIDGAAYLGEYASVAAVGLTLGIPVVASILIILTLHTVIILFNGSYRRIENILLSLSALILVYLAAFTIIGINPNTLYEATELMFNPITYTNISYTGLLAANIGAAVMPWMLYYQSSAIVDKGLKPNHYTHERFETAIGAVISELLMVAGVLIGYELRVRGGSVDGFLNALSSIRVVMGNFWFYAASVGLIAAATLAVFVISMGFAYGLGEYLGEPSGFRHRFRDAKSFYLFYLVEVVPAALLVLLSSNLAKIIIDVMVFNSIALSVPLMLLIRLTSDSRLVGAYSIGKVRAIILYTVTVLILALGIYAALSTF
ncbi:NRAMP family divalent metal transporter [Caldivirga sp.]|uniref:NRAMP family divalent metal transporter n=1 Tax=Caldivirga sp. TaxID=2080243 RepID=UPI0025BD50E4|nr:divalent metal cation transporter [Caldivirga sp.]